MEISGRTFFGEIGCFQVTLLSRAGKLGTTWRGRCWGSRPTASEFPHVFHLPAPMGPCLSPPVSPCPCLPPALPHPVPACPMQGSAYLGSEVSQTEAAPPSGLRVGRWVRGLGGRVMSLRPEGMGSHSRGPEKGACIKHSWAQIILILCVT